MLSLGLLGPFRIERNGEPVPLPQSKKTRALLAYLAVTGRPHSRERLCSVFWDQSEDPRGALRWSLSKLRPLVDEPGLPRIVSDRQAVAFDGSDVQIDIATVRSRVAGGLTDLSETTLAELDNFFRGEFLEGLHLVDCPDVEGWCVAERAEAVRLHIDVLETLLDRVSGVVDEAIACARRLASVDPHRPQAHEMLLRLLVQAGRRDEAERHYRIALRRLEEFGGPPLHALVQCWEQLRRRTPTPPAAASPADQAATAPANAAESPTEGERKQVTVLAVALGETEGALDDLDPEAAMATLDPVRDAVTQAVRRHGGTLATVTTDTVTAVFGAPIAQEDHAVRACHAALAVRDAVRALSAGYPAVRMGLDTGDVVFRTVADAGATRPDIVGRVPVVARRVATTVAADGIGLTPATGRQAEGFIDVTPVHGGDPTTVLALHGRRAVESRWAARSEGRLTPFVGREAERAALSAAFSTATAGRGQVVAVIGEPGVGKSRLIHEFLDSLPERRAAVLSTGAEPYDADAVFQPIRNLLRSWFGIDARDTRQGIAAKVTDAVAAIDADLAPVLPALLSLLDLPVDDTAWHTRSAQQQQRLLFDGLVEILRSEGRRQPVVLLVEDLHWIDAGTQSWLNHLVESLAAARILVVVTYRPEYRHDWTANSAFRLLHLEPLGADEARALLRSLVGDWSDPGHVRDLIVDRTDGNPLFMEEMVQGLLEAGILDGRNGHFRLVAPVTLVDVPTHVRAVLAARIDRLAPTTKAVLQMAAVIGKEVPLTWLEAVSDRTGDTLDGHLDQLRSAGFLYQTRVFPEPTFTFKHALTLDVAYEGLLRERRCVTHARLVEVIEATAGDRVEEHVERLAHHARAGAVAAKAIDYGGRAGDNALRRGMVRAAATHYRHALDALTESPDQDGTGPQEIDLRLALRHALFALGDHSETEQTLKAAEMRALQIGDRGREGRVAIHQATTFWQRGRNREAQSAADRALAIAEETGDPEMRDLAHYRLGQIRHASGDLPDAISHFETAIAGMGDRPCEDSFAVGGLPVVIACAALIFTLAEAGVFEAIDRYRRLAGPIADRARDTYGRCHFERALGQAAARQGNFDAALGHLEQAWDLAGTHEFHILYPLILAPLGYVRVARGDDEGGDDALARSIDPVVWQRGVQHTRPYFWIAEARLLQGRRGDAAAMTGRGLDLATAHAERDSLTWATRLQGDLAAETEPGAAERHYRDAIRLATEQQLRPQLAHAHLGLARLHRRAGAHVKANEAAAAACSLYQTMGMGHWADVAGHLVRPDA